MTILRTYATVNKMGVDPPNSTIDAPVAVPDNVWPVQQYLYALNSRVEAAYRDVLPESLVAMPDYVFPASCAAPSGTETLAIKSSGDASNSIWFAPAGTVDFVEGPTMTRIDVRSRPASGVRGDSRHGEREPARAPGQQCEHDGRRGD